MKKLTAKESLAGTRFTIQNEAGEDLVIVDHLSFAGNKMDARLFAGQLVNAWNNTYGSGICSRAVPDLLKRLEVSNKVIDNLQKTGTIATTIPSLTELNNEAIEKAKPE